MRRLGFVLLISCGWMLIFAASYSYAQSDEEKEYVGESECASCHGAIARDHEESPHAQALIEVEESPELVIADFDRGEALRTVEFPDGTRPFTLDDVVFAMGKGRYAQAYVHQVAEGQYRVLPAQWNVAKGGWEALGEGNWLEDPAYDWGQSCAGCHTTALNIEDMKWEDNGVQCEACHGPGSLHVDLADEAGRRPSDEEAEAIYAAIVLSPDPQICGRCHSQGTEPSAGHPFPVNYTPGGDLLADDVFVLPAPDDSAHWWATGHARSSNMQFNEWLLSAHATSLETLKSSEAAADACLSCHSGDYRWQLTLIERWDDGDRGGAEPLPLTVDEAQLGLTCTVCHNPHADPAESEFFLEEDSYTLCTTCHTMTDVTEGLHHPVQQMFEGTTLVEAVEGVASPHFSQEEGPRCVSCHMVATTESTLASSSHRFKIVPPGEAEAEQMNTCSSCHTDLTPADLQFLIDDVQDAVRTRLTNALARVGNRELPPVDTPERAEYDQITMALTFVQNDGSLGVHNYPYTDALLGFAERRLTNINAVDATVEPTEAPAPTAVPTEIALPSELHEAEADAGVRPITLIIGGLSLLVVLISAFAFFRKSQES